MMERGGEGWKGCRGWRNRSAVTLVLLVMCWCSVAAGSKNTLPPGVPVGRAAGVAGSMARLPCLASHAGPPHRPSLVLWYKDRARFPFYTLDLRDEGEQQEFVNAGVRGRAHSGLSGAYLTLDPLHLRDSGRYRCRVDFEVSPTLFAVVDLMVYVAPSRLKVLDGREERVVTGQLGPLREGDALSLVCIATGVPPKTVNIHLPEVPLVAGQRTRLECVALGAHPSAILTWTKALRGSAAPLRAPTRHTAGRSSSLLTVVPRAEDDGASLTCTASNPRLEGAALTTTTHLDVVYAPRVRLRLGANLEALPITEGSDIYFECEVSSNPQAKEIIWSKNGEALNSDREKSILVSGKNLVLQTVPRSAAGNYTCSATNRQGTTTSNALPLTVQYTPVCVARPRTVAVGEGETARLSCRVEAVPDDPLSFTWVFNNTLDTVHVENHRLSPVRGLSILDYTPRSTRDYGTLSCWAANSLGSQTDPCRFTIIEAGPPDHVANCVLVNLTVTSLEVGCTAGRDGGRQQWFIAQVYAATTHRLLATLEEATPRFRVDGLTPGQDYLITVTAMNDKGASRPVEISAVRLKVAEKRMVEVTPPPVSPLVGVFLGLVGGFVVLLLAGVLLSRRCWGRRESSDNASEPTKLSCSTPEDAHSPTTHTHPTPESPNPPYVISCTTPFPSHASTTSHPTYTTTTFYTLPSSPHHVMPAPYHAHDHATTTTAQYYTHTPTPTPNTPDVTSTKPLYAHALALTTITTAPYHTHTLTHTPATTSHVYNHPLTHVTHATHSTAPTTLHHTHSPIPTATIPYHTHALTTTATAHYHGHTTTTVTPFHAPTTPYHTLQADRQSHVAVESL
ncbi:Down syndrome cell adhesion molecule-like protein Dscam2 isoform X2 [Portunus trituberculatus]|uniref:Down syndrome cell adhesion molecule-like protein Dscam2 isoform X2 n=1 Tax=Portunus trituberculatus TaxID=210409 RepID=UPI001E1D1E72|nr:Down syndrome cell adhesion molecule-like protein Dscam2 isoform X2 [Portunus trituberculatus]